MHLRQLGLARSRRRQRRLVFYFLEIKCRACISMRGIKHCPVGEEFESSSPRPSSTLSSHESHPPDPPLNDITHLSPCSITRICDPCVTLSCSPCQPILSAHHHA